jgi:signal transduction histidine kinase
MAKSEKTHSKDTASLKTELNRLKHELDIEAALEKVRSRAMAMRRSSELLDVADVLREQMATLGQPELETAAIHLYEEDPGFIHSWRAFRLGTKKAGKITKGFFAIPKDSCALAQEFISKFKSGKKEYTIEVSGKKQDEWYNHVLFKIAPDLKKALWKQRHEPRYYHLTPFSGGALLMVAVSRPSAETMSLQRRAANVFDLAYRRFLDLKLAEAQAKEAAIELGLERVRARAMAMQHSDELAELVATVFRELNHLDFSLAGCIIWIHKPGDKSNALWIASDKVNKPARPLEITPFYPPFFQSIIAAWKAQDPKWVFSLTGSEKKKFDRLFFKQYPELPEAFKSSIGAKKQIVFSASFNSFGALEVVATEPLSDEKFEILHRFGNVFNSSYTRFHDLQKAEAQAREAQIEAALERVRAKTMAMHKSEQLPETAQVLFEQFAVLGSLPDRVSIGIIREQEKVIEWWATDQQGSQLARKFKSTTEQKAHHAWFEAWRQKKESLVIEMTGNDLKEWVRFVRETVNMPMDDSQVKGRRVHHAAFFTHGLLLFSTHEPLPRATHDLLIRFAKVFDQTYTRFLDLQKAEAQVREATIEASLERVRSKTMAMHNSAGVGESVATLFDELFNLGALSSNDRCGIGIMQPNEKMELWTAEKTTEKTALTIGHLDMRQHPLLKNVYQNWLDKKETYQYILEGEDKLRYYEAIRNQTNYKIKKDYYSAYEKIVHTDFFFKEGCLYVFSLNPFSAEVISIFSRFANVFGQTYRRYLDLQRAEAQAREAQIEAALERVRSRSMAMHKSEELKDVIQVVFEQLTQLNLKIDSANFQLDYKESDDWKLWTGTPGNLYPRLFEIPYFDHPIFNSLKKAKEEQIEFLADTYPFDEKNVMWKHFFNHAPWVTEERQQYILDSPGFARSQVFMTNISLFILNYQGIPYSEADNDIIKRFARVFEQTYTRFLDLQRAENQAKEARIEASLERVRSKAMSMHNSEDLSITVDSFFAELRSLGVTPRRCGVTLIDRETRIADLTATTATQDGESRKITGKLNLAGHPVLDQVYDHWNLQKEYHPVLRGKEIGEYYGVMNPQVAFPEFAADDIQYGHYFFFKEGGVYAWTEKEMPDEALTIYRRFTSVLSLTYKRYKDLKDAEARAKEAVKQASLDRVRAEIASMRNADDLQRITPLIWRELTTLGVPFFRCGVMIVHEKEHHVDFYLSTPEGKPLAALHLDSNGQEITKKALDHWRRQAVYTDHWDREQFAAFAQSMVKDGQIQNTSSYQGGELPPESLTLQFTPFAQGMLYVGSAEPLFNEQLELVHALADAFSTAYARYEDFTRLEAAKATVERALSELRTTQNQLVQSEKMASLGELTAGIAHEIQNPLNFVNNFSEVSKELLDEMEEELKKGNNEDALQIAKDIIQNLEKINFHGKRADGIVKSMLQHSRKSTGQKELTDINALCDEYLRLAYHGLRAKDKSFNAKFETDFDSTVGQISVLPQEIGRVVLNLINNAFYAVSEKKKLNLESYEPTVTVTTRKTGNSIEISVRDNGIGIPDHIKDKIFQPFFTTKPTGQGTGLGLSLSYDIVKAHGGQLNVESMDGEGTTFTLQLSAS